MTGQAKKINQKTNRDPYKKFDQIDGRHPLQKVSSDAYVEYPVRRRKGGKVAFFNFQLAKEMGLLSGEHLGELDSKLEKKILDTFSLVIINEYDQENNIEFPKDEIKKYPYMATRYLQIQHQNKKGATSGDGRSIWNGQVKHGWKNLGYL